METKYKKELEEHRVIGIRHTLKAFKGDGLIDDDTYYPDEAVNEIKDDMLRLARKWYKVGARRGTLNTLDAFLSGDLEINRNKKGKLEIIAHTDELSWTRSLNVTIGNQKKRIRIHRYKLRIKDLGFK